MRFCSVVVQNSGLYGKIFRPQSDKRWITGVVLTQLRAPLKDLLANCYASTPMFQAFTISDVITDVMILLIPIYWTSKLQMSFKKRLAVCGIFLLGGVYVDSSYCVSKWLISLKCSGCWSCSTGDIHQTNKWYVYVSYRKIHLYTCNLLTIPT